MQKGVDMQYYSGEYGIVKDETLAGADVPNIYYAINMVKECELYYERKLVQSHTDKEAVAKMLESLMKARHALEMAKITASVIFSQDEEEIRRRGGRLYE